MIPLIAQSSYSSVFYGTTKGFDELYTENVSIFNKDLYKKILNY